MRKLLLLTVLPAIALVSLLCSQIAVVNAQLSASEKKFADAKNLTEAIGMYRQQLVKDDHSEYAALISEEKVRAAIGTAIRSYENKLADSEKSEEELARSRDYFQIVKPIYEQIAEDGSWPKRCALSGYYRLQGRRGVTYDGLGLRLIVSTPDAEFSGFALPILMLFYGRGE